MSRMYNGRVQMQILKRLKRFKNRSRIRIELVFSFLNTWLKIAEKDRNV
jgi:hypothetical protein